MDLEHELFRSSKSANLYKAAVLKKVSELKKNAPASGQEGSDDANCESSENESKPKEKACTSSSSSIPEEMQGFTSASEMYSVRYRSPH